MLEGVMLHRAVAVLFLSTITVVPLEAQTRGPETFRVVHRDTSKSFWTGYSMFARGSVGGPSSYPVIIGIAPGGPADQAGLEVGDVILSINGFDVATRSDSAKYRGRFRPTPMTVRRGDKILELTITPIIKAPPRRHISDIPDE